MKDGSGAHWREGPGVSAAQIGRCAVSPVRCSLNTTVTALVRRVSLHHVIRSELMSVPPQPTWLTVSATHVLR